MSVNSVCVPLLVVLCSCMVAASSASNSFDETQALHDERMGWWREARFGLFIHWGLYAEHGNELNGHRGGRYSEWLVQGVPNAEYEKLVDRFNPTEFDADAIVRLAKQAGMKYIVITTKHHEGFSMWNSASNPYNVMATPWRRDTMKEMAEACRRHDMRLGWYYSVLDWYHPDYLPRREADRRSVDGTDYNRYVEFMKAQLTELLTNYGDIAVVWFDGDWEKGPEQHRSREIVDLIHTLQPKAIINNRIGLPMDYDTPEQRIPEDDIPQRDWETCMTINSSWGYNKFAQDWKPSDELVRHLADIASKGGNFLLNIGPDGKGRVTPQDTERLHAIGKWMAVNGESIYGTHATVFRSSASTPWGRCTVKKLAGNRTRLYLHVFDWPKDGRLLVPELGNLPVRAFLLAAPDSSLEAIAGNGGVMIQIPQTRPDPADSVVALDFDGPLVSYHEPEFTAPASEMIAPMDVELGSPCDRLELRYTLDGSEPAHDSSLYSAPIRVAETTTINARSFYQGRVVSEVVAATYSRVAPLPAKKVGNTRPGLEYQYVEKAFKTIADLEAYLHSDAPRTAGEAINFDLDLRQRDENFGMAFSGLIHVPKEGVYRFALTSDDGAQLWVGNKLVADADGLHGSQTFTGTVALSKGPHSIRLIYYNALGGSFLNVDWALTDQPLASVENKSLNYHTL